jgi:uncharacterized phage protein (TIGR01671 family)
MREIEFRAWDEKRKIMHHNFQFIKSGDMQEGNDWIIPLKPITDPCWLESLTEHCKEAPHFRQQFHLMQYTGMKDCTGDKIFENDIVQHGKTKGIVVYSDMAHFTIKDGDDYWVLTKNYKRIGNIHENPELIK